METAKLIFQWAVQLVVALALCWLVFGFLKAASVAARSLIDRVLGIKRCPCCDVPVSGPAPGWGYICSGCAGEIESLGREIEELSQ